MELDDCCFQHGFVYDESFLVALGRNSDRKLYQKCSCSAAQKAQTKQRVVRITDQDVLCMARALVVRKAHVDGDAKFY